MNSDRSYSILVVDDDKDVLYTARLVLRGLFEKVDKLDNPALIPGYLKSRKYDVILLDMNFSRGNTSGSEGIEWLQKILLLSPETSVLVTTAYGELTLAIQAMKTGASDFIIKPWNKAQLVASVQNALTGNLSRRKESKNIQPGSVSEAPVPVMISESSVMENIKETIKRVSVTDASVLISGENGTGKELVARALHQKSLRNKNRFVHVDLGAIPESLFEAELFGHAKGAFTDAREEREGRFEAAGGGTLFLDEIGNLALPLQAKLLTAIQNREIVRLGTNNPVKINIRLISATNMDLYQMADSFLFRQDLLYRINTVEIVLPPLRERREDIGQLANYYLELYSEQYDKKGISLRPDALRKLTDYHWPGNIRELAHSIERAVILSGKNSLGPDDFSFKKASKTIIPAEVTITRVEDYEKKAVSNALSKNNGNLSRAAEELGIARSTLYRKISQFGMEN